MRARPLNTLQIRIAATRRLSGGRQQQFPLETILWSRQYLFNFPTNSAFYKIGPIHGFIGPMMCEKSKTQNSIVFSMFVNVIKDIRTTDTCV